MNSRIILNCGALVASLILAILAAAPSSAQPPTLPEIEVRPPAESIDAPPSENASSSPSPSLGSAFNAEFNPPSSRFTPGSSFSNPSITGLFDNELGTSGPFGEGSGILRNGRSVFDAPAAVSIRSRQEIEQRQAPDMFHALQNEVGVLMQATAAGQASPFVRGLTGQQVLILVDGIRLNNSVTRRGPNQYFNTIDPGMIDHIEVLRGQGAVMWGSDAIGGAINVVTRGADQHRGTHHGGYATR